MAGAGMKIGTIDGLWDWDRDFGFDFGVVTFLIGVYSYDYLEAV